MISALLLCWAVLYAPGTCYPLRQTPTPPDAMAPDPEVQSRAETNNLGTIHNDRVRNGSEGIFINLKNQPKGCFSALNVKGNMFLCLDTKRKLYTSGDDSSEDCRFHRVKRRRRYSVFRSCRGDALVIQTKANTHTQNPSESFLFFKRQKKHTSHRKRRSWHIDPSDPLGSEYPEVRTINRKWEPQYGGNIFKVTISLVDDPLQVLLSHSPLSPSQEKKIRFRAD